MAFQDKAKALLEAEGWTILQSGWPDFLCFKIVDGKARVKAVEVKSENDPVRMNQRRLLRALSTQMDVELLIEGPGYGCEYGNAAHAAAVDYLLPGATWPMCKARKFAVDVLKTLLGSLENA